MTDTHTTQAQNVVVVGGEDYWQTYFPDCRVVQKRVQETSWALRQIRIKKGRV